MYRMVIGSVVAVSLIASGRALAVETGTSPASQETHAALQNKSLGPAKTVRHHRKSDNRNKVAHAHGMNIKPHTAEPFGSTNGADLPVVSPQQQTVPSQTPWTGFHVGVEGGRSGR